MTRSAQQGWHGQAAARPCRQSRTGMASDARSISVRRGGRLSLPRAFSYVEALVAMAILAVGVTAGMRLFGSYAHGATIDQESEVARELAMGLISEISGKSFEDPTAASGSFGAESGEAARADFDDVDDFNGWSESPPMDATGKEYSAGAYGGYTRSVVVENVVPTAVATTSSNGSTAAKRTQVTIKCRGRVVMTLTAYRFRSDAYN